MTILSVKPILRSRHAQRPDLVISTFLQTYPRWIHAEERTHRVISLDEEIEIALKTPVLMSDDDMSRNASSSRALPVERMLQDIIDNPAIPLFWGKNERGMQAWTELQGDEKEEAIEKWMLSLRQTIDVAREMIALKVHKQIVNRILEPYSHIRVLTTSVEWLNYLALRDHPDAEPHILRLAQALRSELEREDNIQWLEPDQWHMPFMDITDEHGEPVILSGTNFAENLALSNGIKLCVSRCASTSYKTVDGFDMSLERACKLHDRLIHHDPMHASPAEHAACADRLLDAPVHAGGMCIEWQHQNQHANFKGFRQYRHMIGTVLEPA